MERLKCQSALGPLIWRGPKLSHFGRKPVLSSRTYASKNGDDDDNVYTFPSRIAIGRPDLSIMI